VITYNYNSNNKYYIVIYRPPTPQRKKLYKNAPRAKTKKTLEFC
jgi:hypothetical protein